MNQVSRNDQILDPSRYPNDNTGLGWSLSIVSLNQVPPNVVGNPGFFHGDWQSDEPLGKSAYANSTRCCDDHFDMALSYSFRFEKLAEGGSMESSLILFRFLTRSAC